MPFQPNRLCQPALFFCLFIAGWRTELLGELVHHRKVHPVGKRVDVQVELHFVRIAGTGGAAVQERGHLVGIVVHSADVFAGLALVAPHGPHGHAHGILFPVYSQFIHGSFINVLAAYIAIHFGFVDGTAPELSKVTL